MKAVLGTRVAGLKHGFKTLNYEKLLNCISLPNPIQEH